MILLLLSEAALGATLRVGPGESWTTITDAIGDASSGDTILVAAGTYLETVDPAGRDLSIISLDGYLSTSIMPSDGAQAVQVLGGESLVLEGFSLVCSGSRAVEVVASDFSGRQLEITGAGDASAPGGAVYVEAGTVVLAESLIAETVALQGGGVFAGSNSSLLLDTVEFSATFADLGGAIYLDGGEASLADVLVEGAAAVDGGGLYLDGGASAECVDCGWTSTAASGDGGAVWVGLDSVWTESGGTYIASTAAGSGGAFWAGGRVVASDSLFSGNFAEADGGALYGAPGALLDLSVSLWEDNQSVGFGGAIAGLGVAEFSGDSLELLSNLSLSSGGGLYLEAAGTLVLTRSLIHGNSADSGGGLTILAPATTPSLSNLVVMENTASDGGGLWTSDGEAVELWFSSFVANFALGNGAHLYADGPIHLDSNLFAAGQGGAGAFGADEAGSTRSFNLMWDNDGGDWSGWSDVAGVDGNVTGDPLLRGYTEDLDPTDDDLRLSPGSPAIDAGNSSLADVDGSRADIGAYGGPSSGITDEDGDGVFPDADCDDADATVFSGAVEVPDDGIDQDCDGVDLETVVDLDFDDDGYDGAALGGDDCDDTDPGIHPDATEIADDGIDQDCDGFDLEIVEDRDGDGYVDDALGGDDCDDTNVLIHPGVTDGPGDGIDQDCDGVDPVIVEDVDNDGYDGELYGGDDCDDANPDIHPDATEIGDDGIDQDCDGADLEIVRDVDGDGYEAEAYGGDDCDDTNLLIHPGVSDAPGDGIDQDCDGLDPVTVEDVDGDGYDAELYGGADCDDADADIHPDATEIADDGIDQDCDGVDLEIFRDVDGDGYDAELYGGDDCDDTNVLVHPGVTDAPGDGIDQDCDGVDPELVLDGDGDGYLDEAVGGDDCDDADAAVNPGATEIASDGIDQDCDGVDPERIEDVDGDGYDAEIYGGDDCDDTNVLIHPGVSDAPGDGIDQDCDGVDPEIVDDADIDGDGFDAEAYGGDDCDDSDGTVYPGATDVVYDGIDSNCDGASDFDLDADGYDSEIWGGHDCDDDDPEISPAANEVPYDLVDQDCSGDDLIDVDGDGWAATDAGGTDCDDGDGTIYPGAADDPDDGVDSNCDGEGELDRDGDGYAGDLGSGGDCDDGNAAIHPGAEETWYDGVDQNCDGWDDYDQDYDGAALGDDCDDLDPTVFPGAPELSNGLDDDCDGLAESGDRDNDGLSDEEELGLGTDPTLPDTDGDSLLDGFEQAEGPDRDVDGVIDALDPDDDNDGIGTAVELNTDIDADGLLDQDVDADGLINAWDLDSDADGLSDQEEGVEDRDFDGIPDYLDYTGKLGGGCTGYEGCGGGSFVMLLSLGALARRRRRSAMVAGLLLAPSAWALDAHNFGPATTTGDPQSFTRIGSGELAPESFWDAGLIIDYANEPLMESLPTGPSPLVEAVGGANLVGAWSLGRVQLEGLLPAVLIGADPSGGFVAMGDARLGARFALLASEELPAIAATLNGWIPTGSDRHYASGGARLGAGVTGTHQFGRFGLGVSVGLVAGPSEIDRNVERGLGPLGGAGLSWSWTEATATMVEVSTASNLGFAGMPVEATLSQRIGLPANRYALIGGAAGLTQGVGASRWRAFVGFGFSERPDPPAPVPVVVWRDPTLDTDGDGLFDPDDGCWDQAETVDGFDDQDGCPELDGDNDGVVFDIDVCPREPILSGQVPQYSDGCPKLAEFAGDHIAVTQEIRFRDNLPELTLAGERVLAAVAEEMLSHPEAAFFLVEGRPAGAGAFDRRLAEARAFVVLRWLADSGVAADQLASVGQKQPDPAGTAGFRFRVVEPVEIPNDVVAMVRLPTPARATALLPSASSTSPINSVGATSGGAATEAPDKAATGAEPASVGADKAGTAAEKASVGSGENAGSAEKTTSGGEAPASPPVEPANPATPPSGAASPSDVPGAPEPTPTTAPAPEPGAGEGPAPEPSPAPVTPPVTQPPAFEPPPVDVPAPSPSPESPPPSDPDRPRDQRQPKQAPIN